MDSGVRSRAGTDGVSQVLLAASRLPRVFDKRSPVLGRSWGMESRNSGTQECAAWMESGSLPCGRVSAEAGRRRSPGHRCGRGERETPNPCSEGFGGAASGSCR